MQEQVSRVVIGMDPHKRSVTIEVMTADEAVVGGGHVRTSADALLAVGLPAPHERTSGDRGRTTG